MQTNDIKIIKGAAAMDTNTRSCPPGLHKIVFLCTVNMVFYTNLAILGPQ